MPEVLLHRRYAMADQEGKRESESLVTVSYWWLGPDLSWDEWVVSITFAWQTPGHQTTKWYFIFAHAYCDFFKHPLLFQGEIPPIFQPMWDRGAGWRHLCQQGDECLAHRPNSLGLQGILALLQFQPSWEWQEEPHSTPWGMEALKFMSVPSFSSA